ncbi:MAG: FdrA protein [Micromonosporaceae bacterium]
MSRHLEVRRGIYRDSVRLMQISQAVGGVAGVRGALVAMATELNLDLAAGMGFERPPDATPNDMMVAVAAEGESALADALARLAAEMDATPTPGTGPTTVPPRTAGSAVRRRDATVVVVSTPGRYAFLDAMDALDAGASVLVFSDNMPVEQEIALKDAGSARGLLVMGPDCGTAVLGGVGLGFANVVRPGPVGLVAASGTGAQQVMSLLDAAGVGVSHCLGVGGRDLSAEVAGRSTLAALDALCADGSTELILVIAKPPDPAVARAVRDRAAQARTPVLFGLLGAGQPDLTAAVEEVLAALGRPVPQWPSWPGPASTRAGAIRGLYCGGSLCDEAMAIVSAALGPVYSNIPLRPEWRVAPDGRFEGHTMIDFGDDALTVGRPHPMIDGTPRLERLATEAADPSCGVLLLDVVLGHGSDPDPAASLAPAVAAARQAGTGVVVALIGTEADPQGRDRQASALHDAGAHVFSSNAQAARFALRLSGAGHE